HLAVAAAGVAAGAGDLLHDHRRLGERQARAAVLLGDEGRHPARLGERVDEFLRVSALLVDILPISGIEFAAQRRHRFAQVGMVVAAKVHLRRCLVASSSTRSQISVAIGWRVSSRMWPTRPMARAITPRPLTIFQSRPSSQASAPMAPVAFRVMFFSLAIASMSWQYLP